MLESESPSPTGESKSPVQHSLHPALLNLKGNSAERVQRQTQQLSRLRFASASLTAHAREQWQQVRQAIHSQGLPAFKRVLRWAGSPSSAAVVLGVPVGTVEDWASGRTRLDGASSSLARLVSDLLGLHRMPRRRKRRKVVRWPDVSPTAANSDA